MKLAQLQEHYSKLVDKAINNQNGKRDTEKRDRRGMSAVLVTENTVTNTLHTQLTADKSRLAQEVKALKKTTKDLEISLEKATKGPPPNTKMKDLKAQLKALEIRAEDAESNLAKREKQDEKRVKEDEKRVKEDEKRVQKDEKREKDDEATSTEIRTLKQVVKESNSALLKERNAGSKLGTTVEQLRKKITEMEGVMKGGTVALSTQNKELMTTQLAKEEVNTANIEKLMTQLSEAKAENTRKIEKLMTQLSEAKAESTANIEKLDGSERVKRKALRKEEKKTETLEKENADLQFRLECEVRKNKKATQKSAKRDEKIEVAQKEWQQTQTALVEVNAKYKETKTKLKLAEKQITESKVSDQQAVRKLNEAVESAAKHKKRAKELQVRTQELQVRCEVESACRKAQENVAGSGSVHGKFTSPPLKRQRGSSFGVSPIRMDSLGGDDESFAAVDAKKVLKRLIHNMTYHELVTIQCRRRISEWQISSRCTT